MSSVSTWRSDVELVLGWTKADEAFVDRIGKRFGKEEREVLDAVIQTRGDVRSLADRLGPILLAKLRARGAAARLPQPAAKSWEALKIPLEVTWSPPAKSSPEELAQVFLERYAANLAALTGEAAEAAAAATALAKTLRAAGGSKKMLKSAIDLQAQIGELRSASTACAHPDEDRAGWADRAAELAHESVETADSLRRMAKDMYELAAQCDELARSIREWVEEDPQRRASRAEAMGARLRAAVDAAASMQKQFLEAIVVSGAGSSR